MRNAYTQVVQHNGKTYFLGRWAAAEAGSSSDFESMPRPSKPPPGAPASAQKDYEVATWAQDKVGPLYDRYKPMVDAVHKAKQEEYDLVSRGYTRQALRDGMLAPANRGLEIIKAGAQEAYRTAQGIRTWSEALAKSFEEPDESDTRQLMLDIALADRFNALPRMERARCLLVGDDRTLAALTRLPPDLTKLTADERTMLRESFVGRKFPLAGKALEQLGDLVESPHQAAQSGAQLLFEISGRDWVQSVRAWGDLGDWILAPTGAL